LFGGSTQKVVSLRRDQLVTDARVDYVAVNVASNSQKRDSRTRTPRHALDHSSNVESLQATASGDLPNLDQKIYYAPLEYIPA
jgi:hypothetical protein